MQNTDIFIKSSVALRIVYRLWPDLVEEKAVKPRRII